MYICAAFSESRDSFPSFFQKLTVNMELYTKLELPSDLPLLNHADQLMMLGSCFATGMGKRLEAGGVCCDVNPFGILYNPLSISTALREVVAKRVYTADDLYFHRDCWHSAMHHGDFSSHSADEVLERINERISRAHGELGKLQALFITWGTAWVYEDKESGRVVGNCHKLPEQNFRRRRLEVDEVVADYKSLLSSLLARHPSLQVVITVSPIRHIRDGLHENQLSKATLLLAADKLQAIFKGRLSYFPAYELLIDELRDYRFYADDLVHPSPLAEEYVWQAFAKCCFTEEARRAMDECAAVKRMLEHRPLHPGTQEHKQFLEQLMLKIERLTKKYPYLDFQKEWEQCKAQAGLL